MKARLLKRLRRKAEMKFFVEIHSDDKVARYYVMCNQPLRSTCRYECNDIDLAIKELESQRRQYISSQTDLMRLRLKLYSI